MNFVRNSVGQEINLAEGFIEMLKLSMYCLTVNID